MRRVDTYTLCGYKAVLERMSVPLKSCKQRIRIYALNVSIEKNNRRKTVTEKACLLHEISTSQYQF